MKRTPTAALAAACTLGLLLTAPCPAAAQDPGQGNRPPRFVAPELFPGFEPIPPDAFGFSPDQRYLVFQDQNGLRVIDLADDRVAFRDNFAGLFGRALEVGFDPLDRRIFILTRDRSGSEVEAPWRFRLINPRNGIVLYDRTFSARPEIRTNEDATVNLLLTRRASRAEALLLSRRGRVVRRRNFDSQLTWGISRFGTAIAFVVPQGITRSSVEVFNTRTGTRTLAERVDRLTQVGFEPFGAAFVIARPVSRDSFRVRMVNGASGRILVSQTFQGILNAGFTPDSSYLGVVRQLRFESEVYLFRTANGRRLILR